MININGKSYQGSSISISGGKVIIDGEDKTPDSKNINVKVTGDVDKIEADVCDRIEVEGSVGNVQTQSGDVDIAQSVSGSISTISGDVDCEIIYGNVSTMSGNVKYKRQ